MKKTGSKKISERYVSALFDVAVKGNATAAVEKDLKEIGSLIKENVDFRAFLHNPLLSRTAKDTIISNLLKTMGMNALTIQFATLLARHKRLDNIAEMATLFLEKAASARGELAAEMIVARSVSEKEVTAIAESLGKAYNRKVNLTVREDATLIGGTIIKVGSQQLDGSLSGKLTRLQQGLKAA